MRLFSISFRSQRMIIALVLAIFVGVLWASAIDSLADPKDGSTHTPVAPPDQKPGRLSDPRCESYVFPAYGAPTALRPAAHWQRL